MTTDQDRVAAVAELVGRTGAKNFEVRFSPSEQPDGQLVWLCIAEYGDGRWDAGAGRSPGRAGKRLLEQLINAGQCQFCGRTTGIVHDPPWMPDDAEVCWYQYNPALNTYQRACEAKA